MKQKTFKKRNAVLTGLLAFAVTAGYFQAPNGAWNQGNVAEALVSGDSRTFNPTNTGRTGANVDKSTGNLGSEPTFSGQAGIYYWTVPKTGRYQLDVYGAQGGFSTNWPKDPGLGAVISGVASLTQGQVLKILVGQQGTNHSYGGSGGGGSFITTNTNEPILIAGGGGGANQGSPTIPNQRLASTSNNGKNAQSGHVGGIGGAGGNGHPYWGDGGGGLTGNGVSTNFGQSFVNGGLGGSSTVIGGFGGGGSYKYTSIQSCNQYNAEYTSCIGGFTTYYYGGAGGGGGYSGGGGSASGTTSSVSYYNAGDGGGGGSFVSSTTVLHIVATSDGKYNNATTFNGQTIGTSSYNAGSGKVVVTQLVPEVSSMRPANATKFQNSYVDVSWAGEVMPSGSSITRYDIQAGTTSGGTNILALTNKGTATTQRLTIPTGTAGNTTIYWRVRAYDHGGSAGPWKEQTVIYSNNVPTITASTNVPAKLDVSLEKRNHGFKINSLKDSDDFNYVTLFADVLDGSGNVIAGSKKQIVLDSSLVSSASLINDATEKKGSLQGPFNHTAPFDLKISLQPDFTTGTFDLTLTKADGVTNVIKSGQKLLTGRTMQAATATSPESYTLRIYPEDRQNTNALSASPLAGINDVTPIRIPFTSDTRNYLPRLTNVKDDVANRVFSDAEGFNRISVKGHVDDSDPADKVTVYYEVQPKATNYSIQVATVGGKVVPRYGKATKSFNPKVDADFAFTYQISPDLDSGNYALLVYGYDSQEGIGDYKEIPFTIGREGPTIDFVADYTTASGANVTMSSAQKQIVAEDNKAKLYFTPNNYATFEYAGYLIRGGTVKDLRIRGAFTNDVKATFVGVDFGKDPITLLNGEQTDFKLGDIVVFKFKATSATGIVTQKDVRILIGDDTSKFDLIHDANLPVIP